MESITSYTHTIYPLKKDQVKIPRYVIRNRTSQIYLYFMYEMYISTEHINYLYVCVCVYTWVYVCACVCIVLIKNKFFLINIFSLGPDRLWEKTISLCNVIPKIFEKSSVSTNPCTFIEWRKKVHRCYILLS